MAKRSTVDKAAKKAITDAQKMIESLAQADGNESETRRRIERIFESLMGYDTFKHLSREHAIRGAGETEHVDFAIHMDDVESPLVMVEIKRVNVNLSKKHLKQVSTYAINAGCEWILLTNSREWQLYHVSFGQPPITKLLFSWDLVTDDVAVLAKRFDTISLKSLKKGNLDELWRKTNVMQPRNMIQAILCEDTLKSIRRELRRSTGISLSPEDMVAGIRRLLNEAALTELEEMRISFPEPKTRRKRKKKVEEPGVVEVLSESDQEEVEPPVAVVEGRVFGIVRR